MDRGFKWKLGRAVAAALGASLAVLLLIAARPAAEHRDYPAQAAVLVPVSGELEVRPAAPMALLRAGLTPGESESGRVLLRNQTARRLAVTLRASAAGTSLDSLLGVRLTTPGHVLADSTLQSLRSGSEPFELGSGETVRVGVELSLPRGVIGYEGRSVEIELVPLSEAAP